MTKRKQTSSYLVLEAARKMECEKGFVSMSSLAKAMNLSVYTIRYHVLKLSRFGAWKFASRPVGQPNTKSASQQEKEDLLKADILRAAAEINSMVQTSGDNIGCVSDRAIAVTLGIGKSTVCRHRLILKAEGRWPHKEPPPRIKAGERSFLLDSREEEAKRIKRECAAIKASHFQVSIHAPEIPPVIPEQKFEITKSERIMLNRWKRRARNSNLKRRESAA